MIRSSVHGIASLSALHGPCRSLGGSFHGPRRAGSAAGNAAHPADVASGRSVGNRFRALALAAFRNLPAWTAFGSCLARWSQEVVDVVHPPVEGVHRKLVAVGEQPTMGALQAFVADSFEIGSGCAEEFAAACAVVAFDSVHVKRSDVLEEVLRGAVKANDFVSQGDFHGLDAAHGKLHRPARVVGIEGVGVTLPEAQLDHPVAALQHPENGQFFELRARDSAKQLRPVMLGHRSDTTHAVAARCRR